LKKLNNTELARNSAASKTRTPSTVSSRPVRALVLVPISKFAPQSKAGSQLTSGLSNEDRLSEAVGLAKAIGLDVRHAGILPLNQVKPATLIGSGKVEEIGVIVHAEDAGLVIVDHPLSPVQQRNLENAWHAKVLDRTGLILEIFGERARSKEGKLQVELARLTYQKSRLVRSWTHLERQRGGFGFLGGPGETQIEADRRAIGERIDSIKSELGIIARTRRLHRQRRKVRRQQVVSLVGYTNAGKSTLFNALSGANVVAQDMLFATLDPTLRRVPLQGGGSFILSDTVGFISELPAELVAAFHATLEETLEADLILHVRDIASETTEAQKAEVERVLTAIGIDAQEQVNRIVEVWNKADLLSAEETKRLKKRADLSQPQAVLMSAATGAGAPDLLQLIQRRLQGDLRVCRLVVDSGNGRLIHWLYENTEVLSRGEEDGRSHFEVRLAKEREVELSRFLRP
jgi:GTPase